MNNEPNSVVIIEQFVTALIQNSPTKLQTNDCLLYGYHAGWLEDMDITGSERPLLRKNAARIIHEFLRLELHEPDNEDIRATNKIRDLYDCRVCTKHIMQVVAKGILEGYYITDSLCLFGLNDQITTEESQTIIDRVFHHELRLIP